MTIFSLSENPANVLGVEYKLYSQDDQWLGILPAICDVMGIDCILYVVFLGVGQWQHGGGLSEDGGDIIFHVGSLKRMWRIHGHIGHVLNPDARQSMWIQNGVYRGAHHLVVLAVSVSIRDPVYGGPRV